jgi:uracil-DNA glycosylase family 4
MPRTSSPLAERVVACRRCPRLVAHREAIARTRRRAYRDETYWGRPVPTFGVASPRLLVVGLAPGAHGANRTGRIFTGDSSGDWLYRALFDAGFANRAESIRSGDGLRLSGAAVACAVRCVPPDNRPNAEEASACRPFLCEEVDAYRRLAVVIALGRFAFDQVLRALAASRRAAFDPRPSFAHGAEARSVDGRIVLIASYHPSRQNTQTGRLTRAMFARPFARARALLGGAA